MVSDGQTKDSLDTRAAAETGQVKYAVIKVGYGWPRSEGGVQGCP